jgi:hypothetical protein
LLESEANMFDTVSLKKRAAHSLEIANPSRPSVPHPAVDRVRERLAALECLHLRARTYGQHIVIELSTASTKTRDRDALARLTALGEDVYGLAFRGSRGGWEPMVLIDTLDEIVWEMATAMTPDPPQTEVAAQRH